MERKDVLEVWKARQVQSRMNSHFDDDDEGRWITTENGHHVHLNEGGEPDIGNPHVVSAMKGNGSGTKASGSKGSSKGPVNIGKYSFTNYRNPDGANTPGYKTYKESLETLSRETERLAERAKKKYWGETPPYKQLFNDYHNLNNHRAVRDIDSPSSQQGIKDCVKEIRKRQQEIRESLKDLTEWDATKKEWVKPKGAKGNSSVSKKTETSKEKSKGSASARNANPQERTKSAVYATGNKWAIENFNATHG